MVSALLFLNSHEPRMCAQPAEPRALNSPRRAQSDSLSRRFTCVGQPAEVRTVAACGAAIADLWFVSRLPWQQRVRSTVCAACSPRCHSSSLSSHLPVRLPLFQFSSQARHHPHILVRRLACISAAVRTLASHYVWRALRLLCLHSSYPTATSPGYSARHPKLAFRAHTLSHLFSARLPPSTAHPHARHS